MVVVACGDAIVHLVRGGGDVEVLGPEHRMLVGQDVLDRMRACIVTAMKPVRRDCVDVQRRLGRQRVDDVVDPVGWPGIHACGVGKSVHRSCQRSRAVGPDQLGAVDGERDHNACEATGSHGQPDGARRPVLRPGDQALRDSAQLAAGVDVDLVETVGHSGSFHPTFEPYRTAVFQ